MQCKVQRSALTHDTQTEQKQQTADEIWWFSSSFGDYYVKLDGSRRTTNRRSVYAWQKCFYDLDLWIGMSCGHLTQWVSLIVWWVSVKYVHAFGRYEGESADSGADRCIQGGPNGTVFWYALTSSNINRFSKLFYCQNQEKTCNNILSVKIPPRDTLEVWWDL